VGLSGQSNTKRHPGNTWMSFRIISGYNTKKLFGGNSMQFFLILAVVFAILAVIFAVQNVTVVTISFLAWQIQTSLAVALLIAVGVGVLIALLFSVPGQIKGGYRSVTRKKKVTNLESERDKLKTKVDEAAVEREQYLKKLDNASQNIRDLEEQLASLSAALQSVGGDGPEDETLLEDQGKSGQ
jgi:uncharacterized integral membrane protein